LLPFVIYSYQLKVTDLFECQSCEYKGGFLYKKAGYRGYIPIIQISLSFIQIARMSAYLNDRFIENENAVLHVSDLSMQRGYAIFDFMRTVKGVPLFIEDYLDRFYASAQSMRLTVNKSRQDLSDIIYELVKRSGLDEAGVRIMLTGGYAPDSYTPAEPNLLITCNPIKTASNDDFEKGFSIITHEHQRELPHVKSINYLTAVWLQPLLKEKQANDVLYYNKQSITEFPRSNVFILTQDNKLVTPARNILKGITRKQILSLAAEMMETEERDITIEELMTAKEVFTTATTRRLIPVIKINNKTVGNSTPGVLTKMLYKEFLQLENSLTHLVSR
jgi:branched-chain amino acid aminotransferase